MKKIWAIPLAAIACALPLTAQSMRDLQPLPVLSSGSTLVIGFLGGFEKWNDPHRGVRKIALDLRSRHLPGVYAETMENHHQSLALKLLRQAGASSDGHLRIILYGQSWGGAAVIKTARQLEKEQIPVALSVQIDSVGLNDELIPANVAAAANLYQHDLTGIEGRAKIRAADPASTRILENTHWSYLFRPYSTLNAADTTWPRRVFGGSHAKMEADAAVWAHVELLILNSISGTL